ncbi:hypothetical protein Glove_350g82 [Diversispora epigaea]|uniref:Uncharacterized protein n=1 Tax=Diversispora epigaea TaxID=1348612 RepID=A0A397HD10_9GLOM|nr:hypothetical protein Glove_350g82 [Diversispora epigaea]
MTTEMNFINGAYSSTSIEASFCSNLSSPFCLERNKSSVVSLVYQKSEKKPQQINYNRVVSQQQFSFIVKPILTKNKINYRPKELCSSIWELMNKHLHRHSLIPTVEGQYLSSTLIWTNAKHWIVLFCAGCNNKISIFENKYVRRNTLEKDSEVYEKIYTRLIDIMERSLELLKDQYSKKNFKWTMELKKISSK